MHKATSSLAAAKQTSADAAVAAILSEPGGILSGKEEQRMNRNSQNSLY